MNTVLPVSSLIARLALRENLSEESARDFVNHFFAIIEKALSSGESVSISGFGEFRVDEATVVFTPDRVLASAANAPFEMFGPVEIGENVDVSDLEDSPVAEEPVRHEPVYEPATVVEPELENVVIETHEAAPTLTPTLEPEPAPAPTPDQTPFVEPAQETVESIVEPVAEPTPVFAEPEQQSDYDAEPFVNRITVRGVSRCCAVMWGIVGLIVGLVIGILSGYLGHKKIDYVIGKNIQQVEIVPVDTLPVPVVTHSVDTAAVVVSESAVAELNKPVAEPRYDTIGPRRFLTTMARDYYGNQDYWVYIYQANADRLRHPDRIAPGTRILIPDFEQYRTSSDEEKNLKDAKAAAAAIYAKYK